MNSLTIAAVARAVLFIEQNLFEPISLQDVADSCGYSLFHFSRIFNQCSGFSPYDYLMRRRLSKAAEELATGDRVTDVAFGLGFGSLEGFSRAFRRCFGRSPQSVRMGGPNVGQELALTAAITEPYLMQLQMNRTAAPALIETAPLCLTGLAVTDEIDGGGLGPAWVALGRGATMNADASTKNDYCFVNLLRPPCPQAACYLLGIRTEAAESTPEALIVKLIPSMRCARFRHTGSLDSLRWTKQYMLEAWLDKTGEQVSTTYLFGICQSGDPWSPSCIWHIFLPIVPRQ